MSGGNVLVIVDRWRIGAVDRLLTYSRRMDTLSRGTEYW